MASNLPALPNQSGNTSKAVVGPNSSKPKMINPTPTVKPVTPTVKPSAYSTVTTTAKSAALVQGSKSVFMASLKRVAPMLVGVVRRNPYMSALILIPGVSSSIEWLVDNIGELVYDYVVEPSIAYICPAKPDTTCPPVKQADNCTPNLDESFYVTTLYNASKKWFNSAELAKLAAAQQARNGTVVSVMGEIVNSRDTSQQSTPTTATGRISGAM